MYPKSFINLLENFKKLPGIGEKSAERFVYAIDKLDQKEVEDFSHSLLMFKKNINKCKVCNHFTDDEICSICQDDRRDKSTICVVPDSRSVCMFEKSANYRGVYHVLNGVISPIEGVNPEDINLYSLINYRINDMTKEVIIALNSSIEGETTSLYIQKLLEKKDVKVSRLSYGIPLGTDIEYLDPNLLTRALEDRKFIHK
ncbi:MAG: recombination mediator RecR [Bacilli bacterium]